MNNKLNLQRPHFSVRHLSPVCIQVLLALSGVWSMSAVAGDYFDPSLLMFGSQGAQQVDLSQFESAGGQAAGTYRVDVYTNGEYFRTENITFTRSDDGQLHPVLSPSDLDAMGVNLKSSSLLSAEPASSPLKKPLSAYIPQAFTKLDFSQMRLNVSVPQVSMKPNRDQVADPSLWQSGMPAFILNYNLSGNTSQYKSEGNRSDSQGLFGSFQSRLNLGAWRLRNSSTYSYNQQRYDQYDSLSSAKSRVVQSQQKWAVQQTNLQRDVVALRSQLTIGETSTGSVGSQVLDGFSYRGVGLMSSDAMIPGSMSGFAPVISGIAQSNAQVSVTQNGNLIYQANVAPGPFRFTDVSGSGTGGDLVVTITEADGTKHGFRQPYSSLPVMQRTGQLRYEVAAGQYYAGHGSTGSTGTPGFAMASAIYGLPGNITFYGGSIGAQNYQSVALGAGFSLWRLGAMSLDATHSRAKLSGDSDTLHGESYRARFSKSMLTTGTTVDLTAYRYSTRNYLSFNDANSRGYDTGSGLPVWLNYRRRSSFEVRMSQQLWDRYQLWVSGHRDNYWGSDKTNTTVSAGLSGALYRIGWSINYSVDRMRGNGDWPENRQWSLNLNVPMSLFGSASALAGSSINYSTSHDNSGRTSNQVSTGGSMLSDGSMYWSASQSQGNQGQGNSGSAALGYNGGYGQMNLGYNYDNNGGRGITYGASGGLVVHQHGVTLAQSIGDAAILVHTPGLSGVRVMNSDAVTDYWGNAIVSSAQTYNRNNINIDPTSLPEGATPPSGSQAFYPTSGAVVVADYKIRMGQQLLMNLRYRDKPVPFGAIAVLKGDTDAVQSAIVGDNGQVYLTGMPEKGTLQVKWGRSADAQCQVPFRLDKPVVRDRSDKTWHPLKTLDMNCQ
ncbi:fimbria/pilus outer membrane usher protein [Enterobacter cloacae complex sp. ESBL7]|uniref:fimbria/pilus outer membrane usher protein n=1 Tax=Enterobacter cloacae complex sp. ESBL7 TaxID=3163325 RepID=UPI0035689C1D